MTDDHGRRGVTRRSSLALMASAAVVAAPALAAAQASDKPLRGALMILNTPFTAAGEVDWEDLERAARFVDRCGGHGVVWPQAASDVALLTPDERLRGMSDLARVCANLKTALVLGVQGEDTAEMLAYTRHAEAVGADALIAMPPTAGSTLDDYRAYWTALAVATQRRVILQTTIPGFRDALTPPTDLLVQLARDFPHLGYVKEESPPLVQRMREELAHRPVMKGIYGATSATGWLFEMRLGLDGVITGQSMYSDVLAYIWDAYAAGEAARARDAYAAYLLMRNCEQQIPGTERYMLQKRGVFKTRYTRRGAGGGKAVIQADLPEDAIAEIDFRFAALSPYLAAGV